MVVPGNVRELKNVISAAAARVEARDSVRIDAEDVALGGRPATATDGPPTEEQRLRAALAEHGGNVSHVAKALGMRRPALYELFKRLAIDPASYRR